MYKILFKSIFGKITTKYLFRRTNIIFRSASNTFCNTDFVDIGDQEIFHREI
jgi:hypothetical protein